MKPAVTEGSSCKGTGLLSLFSGGSLGSDESHLTWATVWPAEPSVVNGWQESMAFDLASSPYRRGATWKIYQDRLRPGARQTLIKEVSDWNFKRSCLRRPLCLLIKPVIWGLTGPESSIECLCQEPSIVYFEKWNESCLLPVMSVASKEIKNMWWGLVLWP